MYDKKLDVKELNESNSKIVHAKLPTLQELVDKQKRASITSRDDGEGNETGNDAISYPNEMDDNTFNAIIDKYAHIEEDGFGSDTPDEAMYTTADELYHKAEEAHTIQYTQHDQLDLENNLLRLYNKIVQPYVAINDAYTWYITNDPKKLPKDCERLSYESSTDPTQQVGMVYLLDQTVVDAQGRTQRKIKIGYTNILRRRLMELQRHINRHNINKENGRVLCIFSTPHINPAKTEKLLHKHFARYRHGTQEVFSISLAEAYAQLPVNTYMDNIQTLPCDIIPYTTTTLDNNLKLIHYDQDPRSRLLGIFQDILLDYPPEFLMGKYQLNQKELLRIVHSDEYRQVMYEYRDLYTLEGMTKFKADKLKLQLLDKAIDVLDSTAPTASDILRLAQMHRELTKDLVRANGTLRKSSVPPPSHKLTNLDDLEVLPAIDIGVY